ncbi:hypothetical protein [uncultured Bradyrhizobium sp.]|uniref:hypothetical protein n=1 Tax=Bradyrhizobium sp. TaxID=376 RepID=UPI002639E39C|nr:hypothetical protein [uncultured Bradyrhizobium sp.]
MAAAKRVIVGEKINHLIQIEDWDWNYSLSVEAGDHHEYRPIEIKGKLMLPANIKATSVRALLHPVIRPSWKKRVKNVGGVLYRGKDYTAYLDVAPDAISPLLQMLIAGKYRYLTMRVLKSGTGRAQVENYRLSSTVDDDAL